MPFSKELFLQYYAKHNMFLKVLSIISKTKQHTYFKSFLESPRGVHAMRELSILKDQIEQGRQELSRLIDQYGIPNVKVLEQSMALDELINEYNRSFLGMSMKR
ncbi:aspartyl-phosphate phosphatase Spo0E family protein [Paenibacillus xylanexedens]|uniref:aspartyl-phosphate phosphatase Spo0E family protein n=1 Tax=Paenibacillus xylanexedens TaxID=528191 RepID=UPI0028D5A95D|nr:aspartyl-phosphate phosphatase Spo0E family protein [Paenibacillus xylanexedens]